MSIGLSLVLLIRERSDGDIGLVLPDHKEDTYVLRTTAKPGPKGSRCVQDVVRCIDDTILATVAWINPKKDLVKIEGAAYKSVKHHNNSWMRLDDAWKPAMPIKGDCTARFIGSDSRTYEWRLEVRNLRKLYGPDGAEHIAVETQFTSQGHLLEINLEDCAGVGEMLYITLLIDLARRRNRRKRGLSGIFSRAVESVLFM